MVVLMAELINRTVFSALILSIAFFKFTSGVDTLLPNQTISVGQTLICRSHVFEMGFFTPAKSRNTFLGIWYKATPDVVVWVANRNNPISDVVSQGPTLAISGNATLAINRDGIIIWSVNSSAVASNPVLQLLDTGNLVLVEDTMKGSSERYLWQSFDYPTDTWLPGMKMEDEGEKYLTSWRNNDDPSSGDYVLKIINHGLPDHVIFRGTRKRFRFGRWNGVYMCGSLAFPNAAFKPEMVFREERLISTMVPFKSSIISRFTLQASGVLEHNIMNARKDKWNPVYSNPKDPCDDYALCGPYSICKIDKALRCECLKGFSPKSKQDWELQDCHDGCIRTTPLNCRTGDGFLEIRGVKYPDMLKFWLNFSMSLGECRAECFKNCSCTAFANAYITNGGSGCVMWFGDLVDIREMADADSKQNIYIRLPDSELDFGDHILEKEEKKRRMVLILLSVASGVLVSGFTNGGILLMRRRKRRATKRRNEDLELPLMKMSTIMAATNNFSRENMIGEGGFGPVYRGTLSAEEDIAVKRLSRTSRQGLEEFKNEVTLIAKLQHTNLVRLMGCCIEGEEMMLIYEYLQNKSLDYFVFDHTQKTLLTWPKRFDIIMGIARGLLYLHHDSRLKIIHRDLKTSNILLDENLKPKISDFGLARTFGEDQPVSRTRRVVGTHGYMAPEYAIAGKFSVKSDIFSMGVVLLEIVSGKKNRGFEHRGDHYQTLLGHAWLLWQENKILELMDECFKDTFMESEVKRCIHVGLLCVQKFAEDRPVMSSVLFMLGTDGGILPQPKEPGFFVERSSGHVTNCTSPGMISERNTITITDLEAR